MNALQVLSSVSVKDPMAFAGPEHSHPSLGTLQAYMDFASSVGLSERSPLPPLVSSTSGQDVATTDTPSKGKKKAKKAGAKGSKWN